MIPSRDPWFYLSTGEGSRIPKYHDAVKNYPEILANAKAGKPQISYSSTMDYKAASARRVQELADKMEDDIKRCSLTGFYDSQLDKYPTMRQAHGRIDLFHSTPVKVSLGHLQVFDLHYIKIIDKANGPYRGELNSGEQTSGEEWFNDLVDEDREQIVALHLTYCHLPPWMISKSSHRAVSKHMKLKNTHSKCIYAGSTCVGSQYFSKFKSGRSKWYKKGQRHTTWIIRRRLALLSRFREVGDGSQGCEHLAKTDIPVPLSTM